MQGTAIGEVADDLGGGTAVGNGSGGGDGGGETFPSSQCSHTSSQVVVVLLRFINSVVLDGGAYNQSLPAELGELQFNYNGTHYSASVNGSAVCTVAAEDLLRLSENVIRDPLYIVVPITCVYALIFLFGLVGNVSTCVVIARNRHMHTATNYYLFSLALSDLLLLVSGLPPEICHIWSRYPYLFGEVFCVLQGFAAETSANATVFTITAFTMERYVAICRPFRARAMSSLPRAVRCVLGSWFMALLLAVPPALQFGVIERKDLLGRSLTECTVKRVLVDHAFLLSTGLVFVAPLAVISVLYVLIGLRLRRSRRSLSSRRHSVGSMGSIRASSTHSQARVIRMLVAVVVAFFICWAPFHAQRLLAVYASRSSQQEPSTVALYSALTYLSGVLYYLSTTVNPVLYHIMSNKFREAFKTTLRTECGWWSRRRDASRRASRQSYANLSGRALTNSHRGSNGDSSALPAPPALPATNSAANSDDLNYALTLTTTFDERSNTYSTVDQRAAPVGGSRRGSADSGHASEGSDGVPHPHGPRDSPAPGVPPGVPPSALKGTRRALQRLRQQDINGHNGCSRASRATRTSRAQHKPNGVASPQAPVLLSRPKPGHPLRVVEESAAAPASSPSAAPAAPAAPSSAPAPRPPSRSPIEALARKLRAIPARSMLRHKTAGKGKGPAGPGGPGGLVGLRADHSAISNSSLQEWDADEQSGAELAELVQYMGELNQRARL